MIVNNYLVLYLLLRRRNTGLHWTNATSLGFQSQATLHLLSIKGRHHTGSGSFLLLASPYDLKQKQLTFNCYYFPWTKRLIVLEAGLPVRHPASCILHSASKRI